MQFLSTPCGEYGESMLLDDFLGEKSLSVKVLINKEDFEIVGEFLMRWKFDFWVWK